MKILIYGFKPFDSYPTNISQEIVLAIQKRPVSSKHKIYYSVFDVRFDKEMFESRLNKVKPDLVIGLGQHSRARKLRIERKAINWMSAIRAGVGQKGGKRIERNRCRELFLKENLPRMANTTVTYNAGCYVCNYSMWIVAKWCEGHGARSAFIHVPRKFSSDKAVAFLSELLNS